MDPKFLIKEIWIPIVLAMEKKDKSRLRLVNRWFRTLIGGQPLWDQWIRIGELSIYVEKLDKLGWSEQIGTLVIPQGRWDSSHLVLARHTRPHTVFFSYNTWWNDMLLEFIPIGTKYVDFHPDIAILNSMVLRLVNSRPELFIRFTSHNPGDRVDNLLLNFVKYQIGYANSLLTYHPIQKAKYLDDANNVGTPLFRAVKDLFPYHVKILIDHGADVNIPHPVNKKTPLMRAVLDTNEAKTDMLLKAGADPNTTHPVDGETAIMKAIRTGSEPIIRLLLKAGAHITAEQKDAAFRRSARFQEIYQIITEIDEHINSVDKHAED